MATTKRTVRPDVKPLYAIAGAGDLVVERLRTLPAELQKASAEFGKVPTQVQQRALQAQTVATAFYGELATRGEKAIKQLRGQQATTAKKTTRSTTGKDSSAS